MGRCCSYPATGATLLATSVAGSNDPIRLAIVAIHPFIASQSRPAGVPLYHVLRGGVVKL